jgi:acetyl esterase/lipase
MKKCKSISLHLHHLLNHNLILNLNFLLAFFIFLSSCRKETNFNNHLPAQTFLNTSYGPDAQQKMDIYLPAGRSTTTTKVMILVHGGGWNAGDKTDFNAFIDSLKKREPSYAIFNINYRLAIAPNLFPVQEMDVKTAIEFIYNKRNEYHISDKFVLLGASAGGHLSLLHAYKYASPVKIKAVVDFFGPTELVSLYNNPPNPLIPLLLFSVTGGTPASHAAMYQQSSPVNFINNQSPPTIILQGGLDIVVSPLQSELLKTTLQSNAVVHQYVFYPAEGHGWTGANLADSFNQIQQFLRLHVN